MAFQQRSPGLRRFAITVDGVRHDVLVEELDVAEKPSPSGGASPSASFSSSDGPGAESGLADGGWVAAPMPGTVTEIAVQVGDRVTAGDVLLILTAMKLENEITAPAAGVVQQLAVALGDNVNSDDRLVQMDLEGAQA